MKRKVVERLPLLVPFTKYKSLQAGQLPRDHLSVLQNLLNFIIIKYLKQVDDDLSVCMDERSPCGLYKWRHKDLSMSRDQKVMTLISPVAPL